MFESFKRSFTRKGEITPQDIDDMKQNRAGALFAASVGAAAVAAINQAPVTDLHQSPKQAQEQKMTAPEMQSMQEKGPQGATVTINPETGNATVTINPQPEKPVSIDLSEKQVPIDPK